ncbi:MAG: glycosyltransferase [Muribaculaceae bacterium]|nr:glycosyltransferase [Muribaculaceae bacterium]
MSKTKILFLAESLNVGGAEKALVSLLPLLDYSSLDVTLMLISRTGVFIRNAACIPELKIRHIVKPGSSIIMSLINTLKIKALYRWLPAGIVGDYLCKGYDVVVAFTEGYLTKWVGASSLSCKKIAWVHTDMVNNDWPVKTGVFTTLGGELAAYRAVDEVVGVSDKVSAGMKEKAGLTNVTTIYNIVDGDIHGKSMAKTNFKPSRQLNLVSVGRLEYVKGYEQLIDAINILVNDRKLDVSLCLVGDGSSRKFLEDKVAEYGLQEYVYFAGRQENPYPYMASADVYVCSSRQEGFNIAILEAMTLGRPVVSADSAGPREILADGKYGVLTDNGVDGLVDGIASLYGNKDAMDNYQQLSSERARHFSPDVQLNKIKELLRRL